MSRDAKFAKLVTEVTSGANAGRYLTVLGSTLMLEFLKEKYRGKGKDLNYAILPSKNEDISDDINALKYISLLPEGKKIGLFSYYEGSDNTTSHKFAILAQKIGGKIYFLLSDSNVSSAGCVGDNIAIQIYHISKVSKYFCKGCEIILLPKSRQSDLNSCFIHAISDIKEFFKAGESMTALLQIRFCKKILGIFFFCDAVDTDIHEERKNKITTNFAAKDRICNSAMTDMIAKYGADPHSVSGLDVKILKKCPPHFLKTAQWKEKEFEEYLDKEIISGKEHTTTTLGDRLKKHQASHQKGSGEASIRNVTINYKKEKWAGTHEIPDSLRSYFETIHDDKIMEIFRSSELSELRMKQLFPPLKLEENPESQKPALSTRGSSIPNQLENTELYNKII
jgi:hypothetical protein